MTKNSLYEQDFYAWANEQAALLRAGKLSAAEIGLAEAPSVCGRTSAPHSERVEERTVQALSKAPSSPSRPCKTDENRSQRMKYDEMHYIIM